MISVCYILVSMVKNKQCTYFMQSFIRKYYPIFLLIRFILLGCLLNPIRIPT